MGLSIYAKVAAAALLALALVAFGWHERNVGYVQGAAMVQDKWDHASAEASKATTAAVTAAASDALANYHAAGDSAQAAEQHQADLAAVHSDLTKRANDYANKPGNVGTAGSAAGASDSVGVCGLDADGLRIWNDANAAANGGSGGSASDSAGSIAK